MFIFLLKILCMLGIFHFKTLGEKKNRIPFLAQPPTETPYPECHLSGPDWGRPRSDSLRHPPWASRGWGGVQQADWLSLGLGHAFSDQGLTGLSLEDGFGGETRCWQQKTRVSVLALCIAPAPSGNQAAREPPP